MRVKIRILDSAEQDLVDGFRFYEVQEVGLGQYFLDSLFAAIDSLQLYAGMHPLYFGKYHRLLAKRFPFAIYYKIDEGLIMVYAILDCRRSPAWARKRIRKSE